MPGVILVIIQYLVRFVLPAIIPNGMVIGIFGSMLCALAVAVWWILFSRAPGIERVGAIFLIVASLYGTSFLLDKSIATANMGFMFIIYSTPVMCLALVLWALLTRNLSLTFRRVTMIGTIFIASGMWIFLRTNGMTGEGHHDLDWRWAKTKEDRLVEQGENDKLISPSLPGTVDNPAEWPGFRGTDRNGIVHGIKIETNWSALPLTEMWRRPVGPGCSSFAVHGNLIYTQS